MAEWKVDPNDGACVKEGNAPIGFMHNPQRAAQVLREHNSHEALVEACKHGNDEIIGQLQSGTFKDKTFGTRMYWTQIAQVFRAALALAGVKE